MAEAVVRLIHARSPDQQPHQRRRVAVKLIVTLIGGILLGSPVSGQVSVRLAKPLVAADTLPVEAVWDARAQQAGEAPNPFRYDCIAKIEATGADSTRLTFDPVSDSTAVEVVIEGAAQRSVPAPLVARIAGGRRLLILLPADDRAESYRVRVRRARVTSPSGTVTLVEDAETEPFQISKAARTRCGSTPAFEMDIGDPTDGTGGIGLELNALRRGPLASGQGLWEVFVNGTAATPDSLVLFDAWKAGGRFDVKLNKSSKHWVSVGGVARLEATEDLGTVDRVLGASLRMRLDFVGLDRVLRPLITRFVPYPVAVLEYDNVDRVASEGDPGVPAAPREVRHRLNSGVDWSVPLLFDTTLRLKLQATYFLSDLPEGEAKRFKSLSDISLEYPVSPAGDVVAVLTRLQGETAPLYRQIARYLIGIGIRR